MGAPRSLPGLAALLGVLLAGASGCRMAPAKAWNLEQLHTPEGTHRRRADLKSDLGYLLGSLASSTGYGGDEYRAEQARAGERVKDPPGECLENAIALGECARDAKVAGLQAASFALLAVDCPYVLTRERSVLELGPLAQALGVPAQPALPPGEALDSAQVKEHFDRLVATVREVVAVPGLAGDALERACGEIAALPLDRLGAIRLLRAAGALLSAGERGALYAPLRELRLELARRCTILALREAREDRHGLVRAAALEAGVLAFPAERAALLRWALVEPMEEVEERGEVSLRALELLARYGEPPRPEGEDARTFTRFWLGHATRHAALQLDSRHTSAACRALAKLTGQPPTLLPEVWMQRARERDALQGEAAAPETVP